MTLAAVFPVNAFLPVISSYSTAPNEKMSDRGSASLPSTCSGDMYCGVPAIAPAWVSPIAIVLVASASPTGVLAVARFASPKSSSLTPARVIRIFAGFRSR